MVRLEFNGKPFDAATFEDALIAAALEAVITHVREQVAGIRDPVTGEFPIVVIRATSLDDIQLHIEGSDAVIACVREALNVGDDADSVENDSESKLVLEPPPPKVFLSYAFEDRSSAEGIARGLIRSGIDTWWAEWEIGIGDSLRQKIDAGLRDCTHFLILLTPISIMKPWVNQEIDAGFVLMLDKTVRFLPVRSGLAVSSLPPLLRGMYSPDITDPATDLQQLIHDILGVTRKPTLGPLPPLAKSIPQSRASLAATALARAFVERSERATEFDPQFTKSELMTVTGLSKDDLNDAIFELRGSVKVHEYSGGGFVSAHPKLYADFDVLWQPWDPAQDALQLASDLYNDPTFPNAPREIASRYGWSPRRFNPALAYLMDRDLVETLSAIGEGTFLTVRVLATDATRRFVKSRGV